MKRDDKMELTRRLAELRQFFDLDEIAARSATETHNIARYYRLNKAVYHIINSSDGFVHMGISRDGIFKEQDFWEQGKMIAELIREYKAQTVLELAAGKAATTKFLAQQFPDVKFTGLDLPHGQLKTISPLTNLSLQTGDYHDLSRFKANSFDIIYIIEALCHARDKRQVAGEVFRVLKPGGLFIIFDGYNAKSDAQMSDQESFASSVLWKSMMVGAAGHHYQTFRQMLKKEGLPLIEEENLSRFVLPSMYRLERKGRRFLSHKHLMKIFTKLMPTVMTANLIAAHLFPVTVRAGIHEYWLSVAQKKKSSTK